jgi:hypothetical protein
MDSPARWTAEALEADKRWMFRIDEKGRRDLLAAVERAHDPDRALLDYHKEDFDLGAAMPVIDAAMRETKHARNPSS